MHFCLVTLVLGCLFCFLLFPCHPTKASSDEFGFGPIISILRPSHSVQPTQSSCAVLVLLAPGLAPCPPFFSCRPFFFPVNNDLSCISGFDPSSAFCGPHNQYNRRSPRSGTFLSLDPRSPCTRPRTVPPFFSSWPFLLVPMMTDPPPSRAVARFCSRTS